MKWKFRLREQIKSTEIFNQTHEARDAHQNMFAIDKL